MKKVKQPGDNISLKTKKNESAAIMEWINSQSNLMDSIRYLIENEISAKGIRNLQNFIPAERNIDLSGARHHEQVEEPQIQQQALPPVEDDIDDEDIESWI